MKSPLPLFSKEGKFPSLVMQERRNLIFNVSSLNLMEFIS